MSGTTGNFEQVLGYLGGCILAVQAVPQVVKVVQRRSAKDLSYMTIAFVLLGGSLTVAYGVLINEPPVFATVSFTVFMNMVLLFLKVYFDHTRDSLGMGMTSSKT